MRNLRGTYVHRGDAARWRSQFKQTLIATASIVLTVFVLTGRETTPADAEPVVTAGRPFDRADKVIQYSIKYGITASLATSILDASLRENIDPELAFRLVLAESEFNPHAVSRAGAVGLAQLMPSTAADIEKGVTREQLFDPNTNVRIGFRYLRSLLDQYDGDLRLALLAYNRGEVAVWRDVRAGVNPGNGYDRYVMRDYKGTGLLQ